MHVHSKVSLICGQFQSFKCSVESMGRPRIQGNKKLYTLYMHVLYQACNFYVKNKGILTCIQHVYRLSRHRKGLLPTPKRSPLTSSSPSQRISTATPPTSIHVNPPVTTPQINPSLPYPIPSTIAGYAGSHAHTYTTSFTATAPVQNTVIVQQPGQSVYVQQQVCVYGVLVVLIRDNPC